tara:strand:+ start:1835 stop:2050 length:216 start_codon:yes stop_codon:yes gene_type:complete
MTKNHEIISLFDDDSRGYEYEEFISYMGYMSDIDLIGIFRRIATSAPLPVKTHECIMLAILNLKERANYDQ